MKRLTLALLFATTGTLSLAQSAAVGTKSKRAQIGTKAHLVAPALNRYAREVLLGDLWMRPGLSLRDRSLVTISALITRNQTAEMDFYFDLALENGVKPGEISETLTHLAFYSGWGNAMAAMKEAQVVFTRHRIPIAQLPLASGPHLPVDEAAEAKRIAITLRSLGPEFPGLVQYTNEVVFADLWLRPALAPRDRSLVTISALIASGQLSPFANHLNRAMDFGLTETQAAEVITHLAFYAGWPYSVSAAGLARTVFAQRRQDSATPAEPHPEKPSDSGSITVLRKGTQPSTQGAPERFTGSVRVDPLFAPEGGSRASAGLVTFEPGARTAWHVHALGQTLIVTAGSGRVQSWGSPVVEIHPGDVVRIPPGVKHWHGASPSTSMSHIAIQEQVEGRSVEWLEQVSEAQYAPRSTTGLDPASGKKAP